MAEINELGDVVDAWVSRGLPMGLDRAALDAVRRWRFSPATLDGAPVAVTHELTIRFQFQ